MKCGETLGKLIFLERRLEGKSTKSKSQNLDQDSHRNRRVNEIEISDFENRQKLKLK